MGMPGDVSTLIQCHPQKTKAVDAPGAGVTGGCDLTWVLELELGFPARASSTLYL